MNAPAAVEGGRTALEGAAEHGRLDMMQLFFNAGVELHGSGKAQYERAIKLASKYGHNTVRKFIDDHYESGRNEWFGVAQNDSFA